MIVIADCPNPVIIEMREVKERDVADPRHIIITTVDNVFFATIRCDKYQERIAQEPSASINKR